MSIDKTLVDFFEKKSKNLRSKNRIKYSEDILIKKIAFDYFKVDNDPYEGLWKMEEHDGEKYLVRSSGTDNDQKTIGDWTAVSDHSKSNITLAYKNVPVALLSSSEYKFDKDSIMTFKSALLDVIGKDEGAVKDILQLQPKAKTEALSSTFPELKKFL